MKKTISTLLFLFLIIFIHFSASIANPQVYIVYLGNHNGDKTEQEIEEIHHSYLHRVKLSREAAQASLIYSYKNAINGFAASLHSEEATTIADMDGVISVFPSKSSELQTTRSWDFINRYSEHTASSVELLRAGNHSIDDLPSTSQDLVVGVIDSGVSPQSKSFNDQGMEPVPPWWTGSCDGLSSQCNRKIIGAQFFKRGAEAMYGPINPTIEYLDAKDGDGHGSHTASIVGGRKVEDVSFLGGFARGAASGGATLVRLAIYKACWRVIEVDGVIVTKCTDADVAAAIDAAIKDGVHVLSMSLGTRTDSSYFRTNAMAIGTLSAIKKNIAVVCAAGNWGAEGHSTVANVAPWMFTIAASSLDRTFPVSVQLGDDYLIIQGESIAVIEPSQLVPLVYAGDVEVPGVPPAISGNCVPGSLSPNLVSGKIVLCLTGNDVEQTLEVQRAGGVGAILGTTEVEVQVRSYLIPATKVFHPTNTQIIWNYIRNSRNPVARIMPGTTAFDARPSPAMAVFSGIGPSLPEQNIIKPDITAPGLNILAAWSDKNSPLGIPQDTRRVEYNIISGTSMACPHVSAAVLYLKSWHPDWSPAAIKSALMTTASTSNIIGQGIKDGFGNDAVPFHYGAGHIRPDRANDPGLVYDTTYEDYLNFLCYVAGGQTPDPSYVCPPYPSPPSNLNYPTLAMVNIVGRTVVQRTVTHVGSGWATYNLQGVNPIGFLVEFSTNTMTFTQVGEKQSFTIAITPQSVQKVGRFEFGFYAWSDGIHTVTSQIAVSSAVSTTPTNDHDYLQLQRPLGKWNVSSI